MNNKNIPRDRCRIICRMPGKKETYYNFSKVFGEPMVTFTSLKTEAMIYTLKDLDDAEVHLLKIRKQFEIEMYILEWC